MDTSETGEHEIFVGEVPDTLTAFPDNHFHAVVTDPPYNFKGGFMSQDWDNIGTPKEYQEWCEAWSREIKRVLRPGGHMLSFSSSQTYHRMASGIEDAGFDYRDVIMYLYGGGFPKGYDIEKGIDRKLGVEDEREVVDERVETSGYKSQDKANEEHGHRPDRYYDDTPDTITEEEPASDLAKRFEGFNSALKPALEPIAVARNPLEEDTIAEQVMATGTGGLNIGECRIPSDGSHKKPTQPTNNDRDVYGEQSEFEPTNADGRYPANLALDEAAAAMLDEQSGERVSASAKYGSEDGDNAYFGNGGDGTYQPHGDYKGGASRYFYTSKASKSERNANGKINNNHPTVKPVDLMEYLVKLVTAEGQRVLDPFLGSGTTLLAAERTDRVCYGVEKQEKWAELSRDRIAAERGALESTSILDCL